MLLLIRTKDNLAGVDCMFEKINRRQFVKKSTIAVASAVALPLIIPSPVRSRLLTVSPNDRITMGFIGVGGMGTGNLRGFIEKPEVQVVAVCDVDTNHCNRARDLVNERYGNRDCDTYSDFRELLVRDDIDAVCLATPDQWHGILAVATARSGKDAYGEKPLSYNISEGRAIVDAVNRYGIVWQTGSQQRSDRDFRFACELVRNGYIGEVSLVRVGLPYGNSIRAGNTQPSPVPKGFNFDMWLGPAPETYYCEARCHWNFRWISDYSQGQLTDWAGHHIDIAKWGMDVDLTAPVEIQGRADYPKAVDGLFDTPPRYRFECKYEAGLTIIVSDTTQHPRGMGVLFEGSEGWIHVNRSGIWANPEYLLKHQLKPDDIHLYESDDHRQNFLDCVKTRQKCIAPVDVAFYSIMVAHLGVIAMKLGRKVTWDSKKEKFVNDSEADRILSRPMRSPWQLNLT
jgi:predicted dehydrogenase